MKKEINFSRILILLIYFITMSMLAIPKQAYAYLDPGTGSFIVQIVIASLLSVGFFVKSFWRNIKMIFVKLLTALSPKNDSKKQE